MFIIEIKLDNRVIKTFLYNKLIAATRKKEELLRNNKLNAEINIYEDNSK
jgi:hypothetical protein